MTNYKNILKILTFCESLTTPDSLWRAVVAPNFYAPLWLDGAKKAGISQVYHTPENPEHPCKVYSLPPPGITHDPHRILQTLSPDDIRYFYRNGIINVVANKEELREHTISFTQLAKALAKTCGINSNKVASTHLIQDQLVCLTPHNTPVYFAFCFSKCAVENMLKHIRAHYPCGEIGLLVMGTRWRNSHTLSYFRKEYNAHIAVVPELFESTQHGFTLLKDAVLPHFLLPTPSKACWQDIYIEISGTFDITIDYVPHNSHPRRIATLHYMDEKEFYSVRRAHSPHKDAFKLLLCYSKSDTPILSQQDIKKSEISDVQTARKKLIKVLHSRVPMLAHLHPFQTYRSKNMVGTKPLFHVKYTNG